MKHIAHHGPNCAKVQGLAEGPECHCLFVTNFTGYGTQAFYDRLHDWVTNFEDAMHAVIAVPQLHGSATIHIHFASHGAARDAKAWFDNHHRLTKHLRHAPASRLSCKFSNYAPATCPQELRIPHHSMWSHPVVLASWDPQVIHPYPCSPPPCPVEQSPTAWNEWYLEHCGLARATPGSIGVPGTHQARWTDPAARRGRSTSRPCSATPAR